MTFKEAIHELSLKSADCLKDAEGADKDNWSASTRLTRALRDVSYLLEETRRELRRKRREIESKKADKKAMKS